MPNERKMRVKDEGEAADHVVRLSESKSLSTAETRSRTILRSLVISAARDDIRTIPKFAIAVPRWLERPAKILKPIETLFDNIDAGGVAQPNGPIVTKSCSRHNRDIRFTQESVGEIL